MQKKNLVFLLVFFISLFIISCNNGNSVDLSSGAEENLKQLAQKKDNELLWNTEIESFRLSKNTSTSASVASTIKLSPEIVALSDDNAPVYPVLEGFSSLDTSHFSASLYDYAEGVCKAVSKWTLSSKDMAENSDYSLVLFKYDVESLWMKYNGTQFSSDGEIRIFNEWLLGEPFISEEEIQVPVRFFNKKCYLDVLLYIHQQKDYKLDQIIIQKMEKR